MTGTTQTWGIGNCIELMQKLPDESIDTGITSPPCWGVQDSGVEGQIGLEPTLKEYHERLLEVTAEFYRVLKPTGVLFWSHGDSYDADGGKLLQNERLILRMIDEQGWILRNRIVRDTLTGMPISVTDRFPDKYEPVYMLVKTNKPLYYRNNKTGALQRNKPSGTKGEEGVDWDWKDVVTESGTKRKKVSNWRGRSYWFDLDAVRKPYSPDSEGRANRAKTLHTQTGSTITDLNKHRRFDTPSEVNTLQTGHTTECNPLGKNPGDVVEMTQVEWLDYCDDIWDLFAEERHTTMRIPIQSCNVSHFTTFPTALIEMLINAACPAEICPECGMARERITEKFDFGREDTNSDYAGDTTAGRLAGKRQAYRRLGFESPPAPKTIGWTSCNCNAGWIAGTALDPFCGSGTVLKVCRHLNRNAIGIEIDPQWVRLYPDRSMAHTPPLGAYV